MPWNRIPSFVAITDVGPPVGKASVVLRIMINTPTEQTPHEPPASPWRIKAEMAQYYRCDIRTITNLMRRRILPFVKIGRLVRFNPAECDEAMQKFKRRSSFL
jgi:excisionase family DNA binding protein